MNFLHQEFDAGPDDVLDVVLDHAANVQLLDQANYQSYRAGRPFRYHGGYVERSPFRIQPPHQGHWHLVVDLGGNAGTVRASIRMISGAVA